MDYFIAIATFAVIAIALFMCYQFVVSLFEDLAGKPLYVHLYKRLETLSPSQESILRQNFPFYTKLDSKRKRYFNHRVARFIANYEFLGREGFVVTDEVKLRISGTFIMLTFGYRHYLLRAFTKIILYPDVYFSTITEEYHKGEFNPGLKAIVFSWNDFVLGYQDSTDNLNLGIHEFAHVLHFHSTRKTDSTAAVFSKHFKIIQEQVNHVPNQKRLIASDYFRMYAYTNQFEFISVIIEHYMETPHEFKAAFPELFHNIRRMLNHRH
jgi:MtfA peptidase